MTIAPIANSESGSSVRTKLNTLINQVQGQESITSDHTAPTDVDLTFSQTLVTTDGSGLAQIVNLPLFALDGNGLNIDKIGTRHQVAVAAQVNPGDVVHVTVDGGGAAAINLPTIGGLPSVPYALLDYEDSSADFVWVGYTWFLDLAIFNNDTPFTPSGGGFPSILPSSDFHNIVFNDFPIADPSVDDAIFTDQGTLKVSGLISTTVTTDHTLTRSFDLSYESVDVTTDGSGLAQTLDIPNLPLDGNGYNPSTGRRVYVRLVDQANPSDVLRVTINGGVDLSIHDTGGVFLGTATGQFAVLDYAGSDTTFIWNGYGWDWSYENANNVTVIDYSGRNGIFTSENDGNTYAHNLSTSDPHVVGQVYTLAGALMVSAG